MQGRLVARTRLRPEQRPVPIFVTVRDAERQANTGPIDPDWLGIAEWSGGANGVRVDVPHRRWNPTRWPAIRVEANRNGSGPGHRQHSSRTVGRSVRADPRRRSNDSVGRLVVDVLNGRMAPLIVSVIVQIGPSRARTLTTAMSVVATVPYGLATVCLEEDPWSSA
jgi:hypothetical protein